MNTVPAELAFWRELHHPGERRYWRCRPTPLGVQVQYREETETEWEGRVCGFEAPPEATVHAPQRLATHLGSFDSADVSPVHQYVRRMEAAAREARVLVEEQLAEGFVDVSRVAGLQFWEMCESLWRFESRNDSLVEQLVAGGKAVSEQTRVRVGRALTHRAAGPWTTSLDGEGPQIAWWPSTPSDDERARALDDVRVEADEISVLLLPLRVHRAPIAEEAMRALTLLPVPDELAFAVLYDLLVHPGLYYALPHEPLVTLARRMKPRPEWIASLLAYGEAAPTATSTRMAADERHFQRGFQAFAVLACWTHDHHAAEVLFHAKPLTSTQCFVIAAETHPRRRWANPLSRQRKSVSADQQARYDAAIAACAAASDE